MPRRPRYPCVELAVTPAHHCLCSERICSERMCSERMCSVCTPRLAAPCQQHTSQHAAKSPQHMQYQTLLHATAQRTRTSRADSGAIHAATQQSVATGAHHPCGAAVCAAAVRSRRCHVLLPCSAQSGPDLGTCPDCPSIVIVMRNSALPCPTAPCRPAAPVTARRRMFGHPLTPRRDATPEPWNACCQPAAALRVVPTRPNQPATPHSASSVLRSSSSSSAATSGAVCPAAMDPTTLASPYGATYCA